MAVNGDWPQNDYPLGPTIMGINLGLLPREMNLEAQLTYVVA